MKMFGCCNYRVDDHFYHLLKRFILWSLIAIITLISVCFIETDLNQKIDNTSSEYVLEQISFFLIYAIYLGSSIVTCSYIIIIFIHLHYINEDTDLRYENIYT